jgi:hypothetical protein
VTGTGDPGTGTAICAKAAINNVPPTIKVAWVSAVLRGKTVARSDPVEIDIYFPFTALEL